MIKGNIDNIKSIELVKATSGLPYNTMGDVFVRTENGFEFNSEYIYDSGATSKTSVFLTENQVEALYDSFKVVEYILPKKEYKIKKAEESLEKIKKEYEEALEELKKERVMIKQLVEDLGVFSDECSCTECDSCRMIVKKIKDKLKEYEDKLAELEESDNTNEWADEAMTVYLNMITLLKYLLK